MVISKNRQRYTTGWGQTSYIRPQIEVNYDYMRTNGKRTNKRNCIFFARERNGKIQTCLHLGYEISRSKCTNCKSFTNLYLRILGDFGGSDE